MVLLHLSDAEWQGRSGARTHESFYLAVIADFRSSLSASVAVYGSRSSELTDMLFAPTKHVDFDVRINFSADSKPYIF